MAAGHTYSHWRRIEAGVGINSLVKSYPGQKSFSGIEPRPHRSFRPALLRHFGVLFPRYARNRVRSGPWSFFGLRCASPESREAESAAKSFPFCSHNKWRWRPSLYLSVRMRALQIREVSCRIEAAPFCCQVVQFWYCFATPLPVGSEFVAPEYAVREFNLAFSFRSESET